LSYVKLLTVKLDKELQRITRKTKKGKNFTDKLVKVCLKNGAEQWLLIHIEIQGAHEEDFGKRMFRYFYRLYDKYAINITALAVFTYPTDNTYDFHYDVYGTTNAYRYNTAHIAKYDEAKLLRSTNPFSLVCLSVQYANMYRNDDDQKYRMKRQLIRVLRNRRYQKEEILDLFEFIDDALTITDTMRNAILDEEATNLLEEELPMAYVSGFRQRAIDEGKREGKLEGKLEGKVEGKREGMLEGMLNGLMEGIQGMLEIKFGSIPNEIQSKLLAINDLAKLKSLKEHIKRATDFDQVQRMLS